jgi:hypothetical protein
MRIVTRAPQRSEDRRERGEKGEGGGERGEE